MTVEDLERIAVMDLYIADLKIVIERLLEQLNADENHSGGLLSRETHRLAGELRLVLGREHDRP
jgi:hypothetical protein